MDGAIYKIVNKINNKIYIGKTIRPIEDRWYEHVYEAISKKCKTKLGRAIRKYGPDNFLVEIIEQTSLLNTKERYWIFFYGSTGQNGYNIKIGGDGGPHARSTKDKIAKSNTKRVWTEEMRKNMSEAIKQWHKERGFVPSSEETKRKISEANRGRKITKKVKQAFDAHNKEQSKPIICLNNGKEYPSILAACRDLNVNDGHLRMHLKGKHSHVKGLTFKFK